MAKLTEAAQRLWAQPGLASVKLKAGEQVYYGGAVGVLADGYGQAYEPAANTKFAGFADQDAKGGAADGDVAVQVRTRGIVRLEVTGVDGVDDVGKVVRAATDNDFRITALANSVPIGLIIQHISGTTCLVEFSAFAEEFAAIT